MPAVPTRTDRARRPVDTADRSPVTGKPEPVSGSRNRPPPIAAGVGGAPASCGHRTGLGAQLSAPGSPRLQTGAPLGPPRPPFITGRRRQSRRTANYPQSVGSFKTRRPGAAPATGPVRVAAVSCTPGAESAGCLLLIAIRQR